MGSAYKEWALLNDLKFLDPNIVPRKQSSNFEELRQNFELFSNKTKQNDNSTNDTNSSDFNRTLVALVKKTSPIWDRSSSTYPNKQLKMRLWKEIADTLKKDIGVCMLRWKALREKYIRQKNRYMEDGTPKWELLDEMNFLDKVILYRRKSDHEFEMNYDHNIRSDGHFSAQTSHDYETSYDDSSSINDSSNDLIVNIKEENSNIQIPDSSNTSCTNRQLNVKRSSNEQCDNMNEKRLKIDSEQGTSCEPKKTAEQLFGDLVAALLSKKPERERNTAMIDIMTILSK